MAWWRCQHWLNINPQAKCISMVNSFRGHTVTFTSVKLWLGRVTWLELYSASSLAHIVVIVIVIVIVISTSNRSLTQTPLARTSGFVLSKQLQNPYQFILSNAKSSISIIIYDMMNKIGNSLTSYIEPLFIFGCVSVWGNNILDNVVRSRLHADTGWVRLYILLLKYCRNDTHRTETPNNSISNWIASTVLLRL